MYEKEKENLNEEFVALAEKYLNRGCSLEEMRSSLGINNVKGLNNKRRIIIFLLTIIIFFIPLVKKFHATRCLIKNNYFIWEFTRPISNCDYCRRIRSPTIIKNLTKDKFESHAYVSSPIIAKGSASRWRASQVFNLEFFRNLYESIDGSFDDEECQFLHFRSNFATLREVFDMSKAREMNAPGEEPWYVGWKNCHRQVLLEMNKFYENPNFLPDEAEVPSTNYIFMGYGEGAVMHNTFGMAPTHILSFRMMCAPEPFQGIPKLWMDTRGCIDANFRATLTVVFNDIRNQLHVIVMIIEFLNYITRLDYIPRLMWQGQIVGRKTWYLAPTPECEHICNSFNFSVDTGDIILLDTRIWYHGTQVENDTFSLTITSEYG